MTIANAPPIPSVRRITADEFETMPCTKGFDLDDGVLVGKGMGALADWVAVELCSRIREFARAQQLGWTIGPETAYRCFPNAPDRVRKPDGSFVKFGRLPGEEIPTGWIRQVPDLVFESISPRVRANELERKIRKYRSAGVPLIWVIYPATRSALVLHASGARVELDEDEFLDGENILPGFCVRLGDLFPPASPSAAPTPTNTL